MSTDANDDILKVSNLSKNFGGIAAVQDMSLTLGRGEIVCLIGPNGSGKTTTINLVTGALKPNGGSIMVDGADMAGRRPHHFAKHGVARTFQVPRLFRRMSVLENLLVPALSDRAARRPAAERRAAEVLSFLRMSHLTHEKSRALSGGQQKLLELGRALMLKPRLLLLDEPFAGVHPKLLDQIIEHVQALNAEGYTVIVVDHNLEAVRSIAKRAVVMTEGRKIADGTPETVLQDPAVIKAYTGTKKEH